MANGDGRDHPVIEIGQVQEADFTVNRYTYEDGEVVEEEIDATIDEEDIEAFGDEVEAAVEGAMAGWEMSQQVDQQTTTTTSTTSDPEPEPEPEPEPPQAAQEDEEPDMEEAVNVARDIINREDLTNQDWPAFSSEMREAGYSDQSFLSDVWSELKDIGVLESAESDESGADSGSADEGGSDGGDTDEDSEQDEAPAEEVSGPDAFEEADQVWLAIQPGDEESDEAVDQFDDLISSGEMMTLNTQTNVDAPEILSDAGLTTGEVPAVVLQFGDDYVSLDDFELEGVPEEDVEAQDGEPDGDDQQDSEPADAGTGGDGDDTAMDAADPEEALGYPIPVGTDILVYREGAEASDLALGTVQPGISSEDVIAIPLAAEDEAAFFLEPLPDDVDVPVYIKATEEGLVQRPLDELLGKYA
jgi:hypothetical protein